LAPAGEPGAWETTMDVRIVRERPQSARGVKPAAAALWEHLAENAG
jgi:LysR family transcriptional regulator, hypochlorite-specific transcription factor HypT